MDLLSSVVSKLIILGLVYFILYRALGSMRYRKKGIIIFFVGLVLSGLFTFSYFHDKNNNTMINEESEYFIYIFLNFGIGLIVLIYTLIKYPGSKFKTYNYKRNENYERVSKKHYKEYLYLLFEYKKEYLLKKRKENYSGMNIRLKKGKFQDVAIQNLLKKYRAESAKFEQVGKYTDTNKKEIHYVYLINLENEISIKKYEYFYISKIRFLDIDDFDKDIIFRVFIKENFDIER